MAVLKKPAERPFADKVGDDLAPAGTFAATVVDILDEFGVERQKYQSTEMELIDLTTFLFGFRDGQGQPHHITSRKMRISGDERSLLFGVLKSMLGHAPEYGWDYCEMKGSKCLLTVEHVQRKDGSGVFAAIATLSPMPTGMDVSDDPAPPEGMEQGSFVSPSADQEPADPDFPF